MIRTFLSLLVLIVGLGSVVAVNHWAPNFYLDLTSTQHHQLNPTTQDLLKSFESLDVTLYSQSPDHIRQVDFFVDSLKGYTTIHYSHSNKRLTPDQQKQYGFADNGIVVQAGMQVAALNLAQASLDERELVKLLFNLSRTQDKWVAFLTGHGEPSIADSTTIGYSVFATALEQQGLHLSELNLPEVGFIPDNTSLLVLTSPKTEYLPKEIELIETYLSNGGALLWLMDFQGKPLPFLSKLLGVHAHPGLVIDKQGHQMGTPHPAISVITSYPKGSLFAGNQLTAFPWAQALISEPRAAFSKQALLKTSAQSWTHTGDMQGEIVFAKHKGNLRGPLTIGYLLERQTKEINQKIIIIGNHRFLSNAAIENYGNLSLALSTVNTLVADFRLAQLTYEAPKDVIAVIPKSYPALFWGTTGGLVLLWLGVGFWQHLSFTRRKPLSL